MLNDLIKFATHLDSIGLSKEADYVDALVRKNAIDVASATGMGAPMSGNIMSMVAQILMPAIAPMVSQIMKEAADPIGARVHSECVGGVGGGLKFLVSGGATDEQKSCVTKVATEELQKTFADPAAVQRIISAGIPKLNFGGLGAPSASSQLGAVDPGALANSAIQTASKTMGALTGSNSGTGDDLL